MPGPDLKPSAAHLEAVRRRLTSAPAAPAAGPGLFLRQYRHSAAQTPDWRLLRQRQVPTAGRGDLLRLTQLTLAAVDRPAQLIRMEVYETASPEVARELLVDLLTAFQALPETVELGHETGDAVITLPGDAARLFARGNLVVTLASAGAERASVGDAARAVDRFLTAPPLSAPQRRPRKGAAGAAGAAGVARAAAGPGPEPMVRYVASEGPIRLQPDGELRAAAGELPAAQVLDDSVDGWVAAAPSAGGPR